MLDIVKLLIFAGDGGHGRVSFRREKFVPKGGPDGGRGGIGGDVMVVAKEGLTTLGQYMGKKELIAPSGGMGGKKQMIGAKGESMILEVPVGTVIWLLAENQESYDRRHKPKMALEKSLEKYSVVKEGEPVPKPEPEPWHDATGLSLTEDDVLLTAPLKTLDFPTVPKLQQFVFTEAEQSFVLAKGGRGGRGNESFKGPALTTPYIAERGESGEAKCIVFELKLLADVGLVGLPNAGKSTLLSVLTKARPKVANYPFTTLEPHLGVMKLGDERDDRELVIADIPGLIEGASQGKGLGHEFLRHIENCASLVIVLSVPEGEWDNPIEAVWQQYQTLQGELRSYHTDISQKRQLLILNKTDIYTKDMIDNLVSHFKQKNMDLMPISAATGEGMAELRRQLAYFK